MVLTIQRSPRNPDEFPTFQLFLIAVVRLAEPIALTSIFPYAWPLTQLFKVGDEQDASFYAGMLISAFSLTEALVGMFWGGLSDRIGRKPVLIMGSLGTALSMLIVGSAQSFWVALLGRALGGLLNGNIGVLQTMVAEIVTNPAHEPRAYTVLPFVWSVGSIIGPAIGGTFSEPHKTYPNLFPEGSLFHRFPYLLPNLICAGLMLASVVMAVFLLEETHPNMKKSIGTPAEATPLNETKIDDSLHLFVSNDLGPAAAETYGTFDQPTRGDIIDDAKDATDANDANDANATAVTATNVPSVYTQPFSLKALDRRVTVLIISLMIYTYHTMTFDHLFPIFLEDGRAPDTAFAYLTHAPSDLLRFPGGLGLNVRSVGMIMASDGLIAIFVQVVILPLAAAIFGVFPLYIIVTVIHPIVYFLVPLLLHVPANLVYPGIYFCMALRNVMSIILYPMLLILIKDAVPSPNALGMVNGLAASAGAACRMIAAPIAGSIYTWGSRRDCTAVAWWSSVLVAIIGAVQCFSVSRPRRVAEGVLMEEEAVPEFGNPGSPGNPGQETTRLTADGENE